MTKKKRRTKIEKSRVSRLCKPPNPAEVNCSGWVIVDDLVVKASTGVEVIFFFDFFAGAALSSSSSVCVTSSGLSVTAIAGG